MICDSVLPRILSNIFRTLGGAAGFGFGFGNLNIRHMSKCTGTGTGCHKVRACTMEPHPDSKNREVLNCETTDQKKEKEKEKGKEKQMPRKPVFRYQLCRPTTMCKPCIAESCKPEQAPLQYSWVRSKHCCDDPCPDAPPRFDALFYTPTDKYKREYQQTWVECPPIKIRPRKVCCYQDVRLPPICRRQRHEVPNEESACPFDAAKLKSCFSKSVHKCPRMKLPCCREARKPPSCKREQRGITCDVPCCPYPSYSECCKPCPRPARPVECGCIEPPSLCEVLTYLKRKVKFDLPPPLEPPKWV